MRPVTETRAENGSKVTAEVIRTGVAIIGSLLVGLLVGQRTSVSRTDFDDLRRSVQTLTETVQRLAIATSAHVSQDDQRYHDAMERLKRVETR